MSKRKSASKLLGSRRRKRVRTLVWLAGGCRCWVCGERLGLDEMTLDHLTPASEGGGQAQENLRPAHARCNEDRSEDELVIPKHTHTFIPLTCEAGDVLEPVRFTCRMCGRVFTMEYMRFVWGITDEEFGATLRSWKEGTS